MNSRNTALGGFVDPVDTGYVELVTVSPVNLVFILLH